MPNDGPIRELHTLSRSFGANAAGRKHRLVETIGALARWPVRERRLLEETLDFLRAYPDDASLARSLPPLVARLPAPENVYAFSYGVLLRLVRLVPGRLEIEWDDVEDDSPVLEALDAAVLPGEVGGLEELRIGLRDWFEASRVRRSQTDLELLLDLLERTSLPPSVRVSLFERCELPVRYHGPRAAEISFPVARIRYQRRDMPRERFPLAPLIRKPLERPVRGGQREIDLSLQSLCVRDLEIFPLIYADRRDVRLFECGRGLRVLLVGVRPEWRSTLECIFFFMLLKNGVPVAYGPAGVFGGCCEMGMNLFPQFRGGEVRWFYAQLMRVLHHHLGVEHYFLTRYGMGEDNEDALVSGAFWFYRKLGFVPSNPTVERLARAEEERMVREPGYRSDRRMLRRLSNTEAYLDLSDGRCRPLDLGRLSMAQSRLVAQRFGGDRARARKHCALRVARVLQIDPAGRALQSLAPLFSLVPDLAGWNVRDRRLLAKFVRAKEATSEAEAARISQAHPRLVAALREVADR